MIREIFTRGGESLTDSILLMMNCIKRHRVYPLDWSCLWIKTLKINKGSVKYLNKYRGIFTVNNLSIFEKLVKKRIVPTLLENMTKFQTGSKEAADNLFLLRAGIDHSVLLGKELWITFYDIEKCFDSLWLEDCINCLWNMVYKMIFCTLFIY